MAPADLLAAMPEATLDLPVRLGREAQVRARLLAVRAPQEVVDQRRRRLREEAKAQGQMVTRCAWPWRRGACL
ncbi:hypothetical protein [Kouleothrix sp.]|uniref:hypothetical protein n=1 Tax=Kouleothrix sp. TaxID=2779161 RepID=UPI00391C228F